MSKQTFTLRHDIRLGGHHLNAGQTLSLDPDDAGDAKVLADLRASDRIALPKTKWKLRGDVTVDGKKMIAGTVVELDTEKPEEAKMLVALTGHIDEVPAPVELTTKPSETAAVKAAESAGAAPTKATNATQAQTHTRTVDVGSLRTTPAKTSDEVEAERRAAQSKADVAAAAKK